MPVKMQYLLWFKYKLPMMSRVVTSAMAMCKSGYINTVQNAGRITILPRDFKGRGPFVQSAITMNPFVFLTYGNVMSHSVVG